MRRALVELEKQKLSTIEQDKKRELERLIKEREALRLKENELFADIQQVETNTKQLDAMRKEELDRVNNVIDGLQFKQTTNKNVNEKLIVDRADRVAALRLKREQLEGERLRIMDDLEKVRNGEVPTKRAGQMNLVGNARAVLNDMRELGAQGSQHQQLPFESDEALQNKISEQGLRNGLEKHNLQNNDNSIMQIE